MAISSRKSCQHNDHSREKKVCEEKQRREQYFLKRFKRLDEMKIINRHAAGIDLGGKKSHFVALEIEGDVEVREFGMTTNELYEICKYLKEHNVTTVAMEATGVYWIPLYDVLEKANFEVYLVNPAHAKNVPGRRKDDHLDAAWLQKLHKYGLLSASFRPAEAYRPLRDLIRHRVFLVNELTNYIRRLQKILDMMNVRIHKAVSNLAGVTGMNILRAIVKGEHDPHILVKLRDPRCQCSPEQLLEELTGFYLPHRVQMLARLLRCYDNLMEELQKHDQLIESALIELSPISDEELAGMIAASPHRLPIGQHVPSYNVSAYVAIITGCDPVKIPGIGPQSALQLLAELGHDMTRWPTVKHFCSYISLAPQHNISGGKVLSSRTRPGTHPATIIFRQAAAVIIKQGTSALAAFYRSVAARRGKGKALTALAHKLASMYYNLMLHGWAYVEQGYQDYEEKHRKREIARFEKQAKRLGYNVTPIAA